MTTTGSDAPIAIAGTYNFRAVAPYAAGDSTIRHQTLFRSDALDRVDDQGRELLSQLGIDVIIDLRSADEMRSDAQVTAGPAVANVPVFESGRPTTTADTEISLESVYIDMVDSRGAALVAALREIVAANGHALVHCTAGKDRTGIVIALALAACGVDRADIVDDYSQTAANLAGEWAQHMQARMSAAGYSVPDEVLVASPAQLLNDTIDHIDREFGSVAAYLEAHGFGAAERSALVAALVEN